MESWLKASGAVGLDDLELVNFPDTGRGVKTLRPFKEEERILTIPSSAIWTVKRANSDPLLGPVLRSAQPPLSTEDTLAAYILFVRSRESGYDGPRSHIAKFPTSYSSSIFFTDDELEVCAGTSLYILTKQLREWIANDYKGLNTRLFGRHRNLFPAKKTTIEDYKWALCTVWSRAMDFALPNGTSVRALVPFGDMFNHSSAVNQCHLYDTSTGNISVVAGKNYEAGDQVFIYYGSSPNSVLLRLYGFVVPDNPREEYDLVLDTQPVAPGFKQKKKLWVAAGLDSESTIALTLADPLPKGVLRYLRIQRLDDSELAFVVPQRIQVVDEKISDLNEVQGLGFLVQSFDAILDEFGTPLEKLEEQVAQGVYPPGGNAWGAAHVSIGEQRVLRLARQKAQELLVAVRASLASTMRCENCKQSTPTLMACGRCKSVPYCGRECQVAHFKGHKALCLAMAAAKGLPTK